MDDRTISETLLATLRDAGTATLTMQLLKRGLRAVWMQGPRPLRSGLRIAGSAFTLRFVPQREDVATVESLAAPGSSRDAIETMPAGCVAVIDACGAAGAGTLGDILIARMGLRGVAGVVSDGAMRDVTGIAETGMPVWCSNAAAPPSITQLWFADWQRPIGCGGVLVMPGDIVVADDDGAVVVPAALAPEVAEAATAQNRLERFVLEKVRDGRSVNGLYPPDAATLAEYESWQE